MPFLPLWKKKLLRSEIAGRGERKCRLVPFSELADFFLLQIITQFRKA